MEENKKLVPVEELESAENNETTENAAAPASHPIKKLPLTHSLPAGLKGFADIGRGGQMRAAALEKAELDASDLGAGVLLDDVGQHGGQTTELRMTKAIRSRRLGLRNKGAIRIMNAFGDGNYAVTSLLISRLDIGNKLIHIKVSLRKIDKITAVSIRI